MSAENEPRIDPYKGRRKYVTADGVEVFEGTAQPNAKQRAEEAVKEKIETEKFINRLRSNPNIIKPPQSKIDTGY